jgi:hypothetical protein
MALHPHLLISCFLSDSRRIIVLPGFQSRARSASGFSRRVCRVFPTSLKAASGMRAYLYFRDPGCPCDKVAHRSPGRGSLGFPGTANAMSLAHSRLIGGN